MTDKVLITGGSGFLGYHLILAAIEKNMEVYAAVRQKSNTEHLKGLPVKFIYLDYENIDSLKIELSAIGFDYIIHAAGITKANSAEEYNHINADYTSNLAKAAEHLNGQVKRFVLISSLAALGPEVHNKFITEATNPNPVTNYGRSKLKAENNLSEINISSTILRPTAIYGPRDKDLFLVSSYLNKGVDAYIGRSPQHLSFVHARDVANVAVKSLGMENANGVYNISDGNVYTRYDFADIAKSILGKKPVRIHIPVSIVRSLLFIVENVNKLGNKASVVSREKLNELLAESWACDISKAKKDLAYTPGFNLQSGLEETISWYKASKWL